MALGNLVVKMVADINDLKKKMDGYGKKVDTARKTTERFTSSVKNTFKKLAILGATIGGTILAIKKLTSFVRGNLDAWSKQEDAIVELNDALKTTGEYTPKLSEELQQLASDLQQTTVYGDETTLSAASMLQSLADLSGEGLKTAIPLVQDLAAGMKLDLNMAASLMGKTLGSTTNALSRYGIVIDMTGTKAERLAELQEQINEKFGGRAARLADTYSGKLKDIQNDYGDLREEMGLIVRSNMPAFIEMTDSVIEKLTAWFKKLNETRRAMLNFRESLKSMNEEELKEQIRLQDEVVQGLADQMAPHVRIIEQLEKKKRLNREEKKALKEAHQAYEDLLPTYDEALIKQDKLWEALENVTKAQKEVPPVLEEVEGKIIEFSGTTQEEIGALNQSLGHMMGILRGDFAVGMNDSIFKLDQMTIAMENLKIGTERAAGSSADFVAQIIAGLDGVESKYDEWAAKAQETVQNIGEYTSTVFGSIDNVVDQSFRNREQKLENWYEKEKDKIYANIEDEEERESALEDLEHQYDQKYRELSRSQAIADKNMAILKAIINTAQAVTKALTAGPFIGPILAGVMGALGAAQIALIKKQPIPAFATGGEFTTSGPTVAMFGDNPGGRELVQATPLSSPNVNGPKTTIVGPLVLKIDSTPIYKGMLKATEDGFALIDENAIVRQ